MASLTMGSVHSRDTLNQAMIACENQNGGTRIPSQNSGGLTVVYFYDFPINMLSVDDES